MDALNSIANATSKILWGERTSTDEKTNDPKEGQFDEEVSKEDTKANDVTRNTETSGNTASIDEIDPLLTEGAATHHTGFKPATGSTHDTKKDIDDNDPLLSEHGTSNDRSFQTRSASRTGSMTTINSSEISNSAINSSQPNSGVSGTDTQSSFGATAASGGYQSGYQEEQRTQKPLDDSDQPNESGNFTGSGSRPLVGTTEDQIDGKNTSPVEETGEKYVKSAGLQAHGDDFAAHPEIARGADRLVDTIDITQSDEPVAKTVTDPTTTNSQTDAIITHGMDIGNMSISEKIKEQLQHK